MAIRFSVTNYERWGLLIKTWATGLNYIGGHPDQPATAPYDKLPATVAQFRNVVTQAGVGPLNDDILKSVSFVRLEGPGTLVIRLATPEMIRESETELLARPNYSLPAFYTDMFEGQPAESALSPADKMKHHANRIGDYTLSVCQ